MTLEEYGKLSCIMKETVYLARSVFDAALEGGGRPENDLGSFVERLKTYELPDVNSDLWNRIYGNTEGGVAEKALTEEELLDGISHVKKARNAAMQICKSSWVLEKMDDAFRKEWLEKNAVPIFQAEESMKGIPDAPLPTEGEEPPPQSLG